MKRKTNNPGKGSFARCVSAVKKRGGVSDPNAVCAASKRRTKKGAAELKRAQAKARKNPAAEAAEAYTEFHGKGPNETVTVRKDIHFHKHLAGAGELRKLKVRPVGKVFTVTLSDFKGALLAFNEARTQLFVEGGDQAVNLKAFGIKTPHEVETLGEVKVIEYFTTKVHLGRDGGTATYVHNFHKPYPILIYHTLDKRLEFSGGSYVVLAEGIDK